jgi:hypothetical protein
MSPFSRLRGAEELPMGLFRFFSEVLTATVYDALTQRFSELKGKGLDDVQAGALLIVGNWKLPVTEDTLARTAVLSYRLGDLVIGFLLFAKRIGAQKAVKHALTNDPFFHRHGCLYFTAVPLTDFARKHMNRIWNRQSTSGNDASDAAFAAYYATLAVPFAVDAWMMLAELKTLGFCPEIDQRDHVSEGIRRTREFLETASDVDPQFRSLLSDGIGHLKQMKVS